MGKLNYTNRKISGEKLGAAVKRDVLKYMVPVAKSSRVLKDPHIELNLQGKLLCDGGLELACEGLTKTLESGFAKLDELNLSENNLTLVGLKYLAEVIRLASKDLKDLDLRCNDIQVSTDEDAEIWESFLAGFRDVCSLRRLDISENPLGDRGIEVFLGVYARESPVILPRPVGSAVAESSDDEYDTEFEGDSDYADTRSSLHVGFSSHRELSESPLSLHSTPTKSTKSYGDISLDRRSSSLSLTTSVVSGVVDIHGLRSIPYLIFSETALSDKSALLLSYILPVHPTPDRLLCYLPPTRPGVQAEILDRYDHLAGCSGIIYRNNERFTPMGVKVLELAESIREGPFSSVSETRNIRSRHISDSSSSPMTPLRPRRGSLSSPLIAHSPCTGCGSGVATAELERARSKIQGTLLKDSGAGSMKIWRAALKMLAMSRTILLDKEDTGSEYFSFCGRTPNYSSQARPMFGPLSPTSFGPHIGSLSYPHTAQFQQHHPHILDGPQAWDGPNLSQISSPTPQKDISTPPSPTQSSYSSPTKVVQPEEIKERKPKSHPGNLPENIWVRIITLVTDPQNLLSAKQRRNVIAWARTSESLERERELAGKLRSVQIWRVLDGLECLSCEI